MISLRINNNSQSDAKIEEQWIREQIQNRRSNEKSICVEFEVHCGDVNMIFPFGNCSSGSGGGSKQKLSKRALKLIDGWEKAKDKKLDPGLIISFWKHLLKTCK